jgi:hypothetical protein
MVATLPIVNRVDISKLKVHPKNAEIYGEEDVSALAQSIAESGWIKPLTVTPEYVIISGHRRYLAAKQRGYRELPIEIETFASQEAEMERLLRENENRGKTPEQQIREGMAWEPIEEGKAKKTQGTRTDLNFSKKFEKSWSSDIIARRVGLGSGVTYEKGKEVVEYMDRMVLSENIRDGEVIRMTLNDESINAGHKLVKKYKQQDEERIRKQEKAEEEKRRQEELRRQRYAEAVRKSEHCNIYHCSVAQLSEHVEPESVDCIITDPPYPYRFLDVYSDLAQFADYALKPGSSLVVMTGQSYLPEVMQRLASTGLKYQWLCAYLTPGGQSPQMWERKVNTFWKPILWFVKGNYIGPWIGDVCQSAVNNNDKRFHEWGQSESGMTDIIGRFTKTDQLICDPFVGGGTTAIVAMEMERRFVGCDINDEFVKTTLGRVSEVCYDSV